MTYSQDLHMIQRLSLLFWFIYLGCSSCLIGQQACFPIKQNNMWGLMNADGKIVQAPVYDAIGEFQHFGYAVMQQHGRVGLLNATGQELLPSRYEDLKILDSLFIAVMRDGAWSVIHINGHQVLGSGYEQVEVPAQGYLAFAKSGKWGLVDERGAVLAPPRYDQISCFSQQYFSIWEGSRQGLITRDGRIVLAPVATDIQIEKDSLICFEQDRKWGAATPDGVIRVLPAFNTYQAMEHGFIAWYSESGAKAYSMNCRRMITPAFADGFYAFSPRYLLFKKNRQLGLLNWCGQLVFPAQYDEIQPFTDSLFRVNQNGQWGLAFPGGELAMPPSYDYIAPPTGAVSLVKKDGLYGVCNLEGRPLVKTAYHRITLEKNQAKAYQQTPGEGEALTLFAFTANGQLQSGQALSQQHFQVKVGHASRPLAPEPSLEQQRRLRYFEWFYSPEQDRWGMRKLSDGSVQIEPMFTSIAVEPALGFTLVGLPKSVTYQFDRTAFRFEQVFGLVNNELGLIVTELDLLHLQVEDFKKGSRLARCTFSNGTQGLIDRQGKIHRQGLAFVGPFSDDGLARFSFAGQLSGALEPKHHLGMLSEFLQGMSAPSIMTDYTQHDQKFRASAYLTCEDCEWGYLDTTGQVAIAPAFTFAEDFTEGAGIVACGDKWGLINRAGRMVIECQYDEVQLMSNAGRSMVKVYKKEPKYGLIDTLGQLAVSAVYDEIAHFSEGRLAVQRNGLWGFVNLDGQEVIPCRFREVQNFSMGLAAVRLGHEWGFIDKLGHIAIDFEFKRAGNFSHGLAWALTENGAGYIDESGHFRITPQFDRAYDFQWGLARVIDNGLYGLIDINGTFVQRPRFSAVSAFDENGLAIARYGNNKVKYALLDRSGALQAQGDFQEIEPFHEGLAVAKGKNGYGYINTKGEWAIEARYSKAGHFAEGLAPVQLDGQCGYINAQGTVAIPFQYTRCQPFEDGRAVVYQGLRKAGLIDRQGQEIIQPSVNRLLNFQEGRGLVRDNQYRFYYITEEASPYKGYYEQATEFQHGVAVVQVNGKWGIINQKGIEIIPPRYDKIERFENGYAKVRIQGFSGLADLDGKVLVQPDYEYISYAGQGLFRVEKGGEIGYFDEKGEWVWALAK
ncbi:WG repeat-containing protein [Phaeodactylibacter luteus]|uniref:WG repeat-containing protein n=2 Tax=Phaeodactylibacter luteus TaxID=1564516 RepID=A0A5C6RH05_9BACT|nr:WG repeat-containing protein [Phaeodactylibacter luteus]